MRTLIAGGGTGGHLTPALALAEELRSGGDEVLLVGRLGGTAEQLVAANGVPFVGLNMSGLDLSSLVSTAQFAARLPIAVAHARRAIREFGPDVVVGAAGYVCVPVVLAARLSGIPVLLLEQNALPGRAVRMLSRFSPVIATSFDGTERHIRKRSWQRIIDTGNPVRTEVKSLRDQRTPKELRRVLVMGGSQGARSLNNALSECCPELLSTFSDMTITHITGAAEIATGERIAGSLDASQRSRYQHVGFTEDVSALINQADLVVMRAGGSSLAECSVIGRAMILVPYPHAGGHQRFNAQPYVDAGAAVAVADDCWDGGRMLAEVTALRKNPEQWVAMMAASKAAGKPDAAARVAELVRQSRGKR